MKRPSQVCCDCERDGLGTLAAERQAHGRVQAVDQSRTSNCSGTDEVPNGIYVWAASPILDIGWVWRASRKAATGR